MSANGWLQFAFYSLVLLATVRPVGIYLACVLEGERTWLDPVLRPIERLIYKLSGVNASEEMNWREYAYAILGFSAVTLLVTYALERLQNLIPYGNPQHLAAVGPDLAWNTAASFTTNTNWPRYGETARIINLFIEQIENLQTVKYVDNPNTHHYSIISGVKQESVKEIIPYDDNDLIFRKGDVIRILGEIRKTFMKQINDNTYESTCNINQEIKQESLIDYLRQNQKRCEDLLNKYDDLFKKYKILDDVVMSGQTLNNDRFIDLNERVDSIENKVRKFIN